MPGITGSKKLATFIGDALIGRAGCDIIHLGDSNTGHQEGGQTHNGWVDGFMRAAVAIQPDCMYGTPIYPMGVLGSPNYGPGVNAGYSSDLTANSVTPSFQDYVGTGNDSFPVYPILQRLVSPLKAANTNSSGCIWRTTSTADRYASFIAGIYIPQTSSIPVNGFLYYRVVGGLFNDATSEMRVLLRNNGTGASLEAYRAISFYSATAPGTIAHQSTTFSPAARNCDLQFGTAGAGVGTANGWKAPFAFGWNSVTRSKAGLSCSVLSHHGSATLKGVLDNVLASTDGYLETYCREIILRQKQSSGLNYARVVFWINAGQNGGGTVTTNYWELHAPTSMTRLKTAWIAAGGTADTICFALMTSHQINAIDSADLRNVLRDKADSLATTASDLNITSVRLTDLVDWEEIVISDFASSNPASGHLSDVGYLRNSNAIFKELWNKYLMANTIASVNPTSTYAAYAPGFRGEGDNVYQTAALLVNTAVVLPKIETFPASFLITQQADSVANSRYGIVTALSSSMVVAHGTNLATTAAPQTIVPSISAGVITLTAHASTHAAGASTIVTVVRLT